MVIYLNSRENYWLEPFQEGVMRGLNQALSFALWETKLKKLQEIEDARRKALAEEYSQLAREIANLPTQKEITTTKEINQTKPFALNLTPEVAQVKRPYFTPQEQIGAGLLGQALGIPNTTGLPFDTAKETFNIFQKPFEFEKVQETVREKADLTPEEFVAQVYRNPELVKKIAYLKASGLDTESLINTAKEQMKLIKLRRWAERYRKEKGTEPGWEDYARAMMKLGYTDDAKAFLELGKLEKELNKPKIKEAFSMIEKAMKTDPSGNLLKQAWPKLVSAYPDILSEVSPEEFSLNGQAVVYRAKTPEGEETPYTVVWTNVGGKKQVKIFGPKQPSPSYEVWYDSKGNARIVNEKDREDIERALEEGFRPNITKSRTPRLKIFQRGDELMAVDMNNRKEVEKALKEGFRPMSSGSSLVELFLRRRNTLPQEFRPGIYEDDRGVRWKFDGEKWYRREGDRWVEDTPPDLRR